MCTKVHFKPQNYNPKILQENHNHWEKKKNLLKFYWKKRVSSVYGYGFLDNFVVRISWFKVHLGAHWRELVLSLFFQKGVVEFHGFDILIQLHGIFNRSSPYLC